MAPERSGGLVQVYTGDGKGKTTAALGLALRAAGHGLRTYIGQFLKGREYGELQAVKRLAPEVTLEQFGRPGFVRPGQAAPEDLAAAREGLARARAACTNGEYDIVVLDEICVAIELGLLSLDDVLALVAGRAPGVELVLTGRNAPEALLAVADLVTEMREVRHPYRQGVRARRGIEH